MMGRINMFKKYCLFCLLLLCLNGCEKDFEYINPSIRMVQIYLKKPDLCHMTMEVQMGAGFNGHSAWIEMYDITSGSSQPIIKHIDLTQEEKQICTMEFGAPVANHDFFIKGVLETSKNRFETWGKNIYFSKKTHEYDFCNPYVAGGGTASLDGGDHFIIYLGMQGGGFQYDSLKVSLNDTLFLEYSASDHLYGGGDQIAAYLPEDIAPGDYSVQLYIDTEKWDVEGKVRVFPVVTEFVYVQENHPFSYYNIDASFNLGNTNVYIKHTSNEYSPDYSEQYFISEVWAYDIGSDTYAKKKNFRTKVGIPAYGAGMDGKGYVLLRNDKTLSLWCYDPIMDEWKYLTEYPGEAISRYTMFALEGYIYMGAGHTNDDSNNVIKCRDFWRYNVESAVWERMKDLPFDSGDETGSKAFASCTDNKFAYVFLYDRTLWRYQMDQDKWTQEETLRNGTSLRYSSALHVWNGKVCLIGGQTNYWTRFEDIQLYDPVSRQWSYVGKTRMYMDKDYIPVTFEKDNNIYLGPVHRWTATNSDSNSIPRYLMIMPQQ